VTCHALRYYAALGIWRYFVSRELPAHRPETDHQRDEAARRQIYASDTESERIQ